MRSFLALVEKDIRLSLPWFLTNLAVLVLFVGLSIFYVGRKNDLGVIFLFLAIAGVFLWSIFAGIATYFNERDGRIYEFVNTLPVNRTLVLLSKEVWLVVQATLYVGIVTLGSFALLKVSGSLDIPNVKGMFTFSDTFKFVLSGYFRVLLTLTAGLLSAALIKDMPFRWFLAILLLIVLVWSVGWIDLSSLLGVKGMAVRTPEDVSRALNVQVINEALRFLVSLVLLFAGGLWIERRGY